jgi:hypothetical protein
MRAITIDARSSGSARRLYDALSEFQPELGGNKDDGYRVSVELGTSERRLFDVLHAIELYVRETGNVPARIDIGHRHYTMHAAHA